jgi:hypothetical protein
MSLYYTTNFSCPIKFASNSRTSPTIMLGEVRRCLGAAGVDTPVVDIIVGYLHNPNPTREWTVREENHEECFGCAKESINAISSPQPFMTYHVVRNRTVLTGDRCPQQSQCVRHGHTSWQDCWVLRNCVGCYSQCAWGGIEDHRRYGVWLCSPQCVTRLCAWPTWRAIRNIQLEQKRAKIHRDDYDRWMDNLWKLVATCREPPVPGHAGEGRPWRYEHLPRAMQELAVEVISFSIAGGWGRYWNLCEAWQWDHWPDDHIAHDWPASFPNLAPTATQTPPLAAPDRPAAPAALPAFPPAPPSPPASCPTHKRRRQ